MKLAMLALLIHPLMILAPTGLFAAPDWGPSVDQQPWAHGFSEIVYEFTSPPPTTAPDSKVWRYVRLQRPTRRRRPVRPHWDIACGLVMVFSRFIPIIAPIAFAGSLAAKKRTPFTAGHLRTDTITFGFVLLGTILLVGALMFLPAAALGPVAEHLGSAAVRGVTRVAESGTKPFRNPK